MITAVESFCGAGGLSRGLTDAGFNVLAAFDNDASAVNTYNYNLGKHAFVGDASNISGKELLERIKLNRGELTLYSGGPPCQGFSKQQRGAHLLQDPRNRLVVEYARHVNELLPKAFLFENVEIFGQKRGKPLIEEISNELDHYEIFSFYVCCSDFGLAQSRGRFLMLGLRKDLKFVAPTLEKSSTRMTVRDAIGDIPPPPDDYSESSEWPNHLKCRITKLNEERFSHVPQGGGWQDIPWDLRLPCHKKEKVTTGGWPDVYGRLSWNGVCPTITGGFDSFTRGRYGHPEQNRAITPREAARLQGFPDTFVFTGNRADVRAQIGNAVPPPLGRIAGQAIIRALEGKAIDGANQQYPDAKLSAQYQLAM